MEEKTSKSYIKLFLFSLMLFMSLPLSAQEKQEIKEDNKDEIERPILIDQSTVPFFNGIYIGYDLMGPIYKAYSDDYLTSEINIDINLKNRFFPTIELGYANTDKWSEHGTQYKTKAPYFRIGADYNFLYKKHKNNHLTVGLRYGFTKFDFDLDNLALKDGAWGDQIENPSIYDEIWKDPVTLQKQNISSSMHWIEFVIGVRTAIYKNFYMGWSLRLKYRLSAEENEYGNPWYVPGYGIYKSSRVGLHYSIIYRIPGKKKK